jgi:hypothetical protein
VEDQFKHPVSEKKVHFRLKLLDSRKKSGKWIIMITCITFFLSASITFLSSSLLKNAHVVISCIIVMLIILINIIFDIIGTSVTAAEEVPFHAMASRKVYGARESLILIRNADKVSNICNDVVGDICGVISGAASAYIVIKIFGEGVNYKTIIADLGITGLVASSIVGGKAIGKSIAIINSNYIIYKVGVVFKVLFGSFLNKNKNEIKINNKNK